MEAIHGNECFYLENKFISHELIRASHPVQIARGQDGQIAAVRCADHGHRVGVDLWMRAQVGDGLLRGEFGKKSKSSIRPVFAPN